MRRVRSVVIGVAAAVLLSASPIPQVAAEAASKTPLPKSEAAPYAAPDHVPAPGAAVPRGLPSSPTDASDTRAELAPPHGGEQAPTPPPMMLTDAGPIEPVVKGRFDARTSVELPDRATENSTTFKNADGSFTTEVSTAPVRFRGADGAWRSIDTTLLRSADTLTPRAAPVASRLRTRASARPFATVEFDAAHHVAYSVQGAADVEPVVVEGATATYVDALRATDIRVDAVPAGLKETLILKSADAPTEFTFPLSLRGLVPVVDDATGDVLYNDARGQTRLTTPKATVEDANFDPGPGEGATNDNSRYSIVVTPQGPALRLTLDAAWVRDPARVFPIEVDPTTTTKNTESDDTYVQNGDTTSNSSDTLLKIGTPDSGAHVNYSYMHFNTINSTYNNYYVTGAELDLYEVHSWICSARSSSVYTVKAAWSGTTMTSTGAAYDTPAVDTVTSARGDTCGNTGWTVYDITEAVQAWTHGKPNYGLTVRPGSTTDSTYWKKFASYQADATNHTSAPKVKFTYTPYGALYAPTSTFTTPVTNNTDGVLPVKVTNWGTLTWAANSDYKLSYRLYDSAGAYIGGGPRTPMPQAVSPREQVTVNAKVAKLAPGTYKIVWDMVRDNVTWFSTEGVKMSATQTFTVTNRAPVIVSTTAPADKSAVTTLTPQFTVVGDDPDDYGTLQYYFRVCTGTNAETGTCFNSGWISTASWTMPAAKLAWRSTYYWHTYVRDNVAPQVNPTWVRSFTTVVPESSTASHFGDDPYGAEEEGVNPNIRNYVTSAFEAPVQSAGPQIGVVRTYNSLDTTSRAFGIGWSSWLDMKVAITSPGIATVTYMDGRRQTFGQNPDGSWASSPGFFATLTGSTAWDLVDKAGTKYQFDSGGALFRMTDTAGRVVERSYDPGTGNVILTDLTSGRSVTAVFTGAHVTSVRTSAMAGAPSRTWTYQYTGDRLDRACDPLDTPTVRHCTVYGYDASNRLITVTKPKGNLSERVEYSSFTGEVSAREDGKGRRWTYGVVLQAEPSQTTVTITDPLQKTVTLLYNGDNRLIKRTDELGKSRSFTYDVNGSLASITDENNHTLTLVNDARGNVVQRTAYAGANSSFYQYFLGAAGDLRNDRITAYRDERSYDAQHTAYMTTYAYTANGLLASVTAPATAEFPSGTTTTKTYTTGAEPAVGSSGTSPAGLLSTDTDASGKTARYFYNSSGDLTRTIDRAGLQTDFTVDGMGRQLTATQISDSYPGGLTTTTTYDAMGRLETVTEPVTTDAVTGVQHQRRRTYAYDANGNTTDVTLSDLLGGDAPRVTHIDYDNADVAFAGLDAEGKPTSRTFDAAGRVQTATDARGHVYGFGYTARGELSSVVAKGFVDDPVAPGTPRDVTVLQKTYDPAGRVDTEADALGRTLAYTYWDDDRLSTVVHRGYRDPDGATRDYVVESHNFDPAGHEIYTTYGNTLRSLVSNYDAAGRVTDVTIDPLGLNRRTTYAHDAAGNVTRQTVSDATRTEEQRFAYDDGGRLVQTTVENGATDLVTTMTRDKRGLVVAVTDPRSATTTMTYDALGRQFRKESPSFTTVSGAAATAVTLTGFNTFGDAAATKDPNGNVTRVAFDRLGRPVTTTLPTYTPPGGVAVTPTESSVYDGNGNLVSFTDRRGATTTFDYDNLDRLVRRVDPKASPTAAAGVTRYAYDDAGNTTSVVDATGARTEATYDDLDRQSTATDVVRNGTATPNRYTTSFRYDELGNVNRTTTPRGEVSYADYNAASERIQAQDPAGKVWRLGRDVAGRVTSITDPLNRARRTTYDLAGRAVSQAEYGPTGALLHTANTGFDAAGNVVSQTPSASGPGVTTSATRTAAYDALNRITSVTQPLATGVSATTRFDYDAAGNRVRVTDPMGRQTTASYTPWNQVDSVVEPATAAHPALADRTFTSVYDKAGALVEARNPGGVKTVKTLDGLGRVIQEAGVGAAGTKTFGYDAVGRVTSFSHPSGTETIAFDDRGLSVSATGPAGAAAFGYDENGRLSSRTDPAGSATFTWDPRGLPATATDAVAGKTRTWTYTNAGEPRTETVGAGGPVRTWTFNDQALLASDVLTSPTGSVTYRTDYTYTADGKVATKAVAPAGSAGAGTASYSYDLADRLVSWTPPGSVTPTSYGYDAAGNRTAAGSTTFAYDERDRLLSDSAGTTYTYTPRGTLATRRTGGPTTSLTFDAFDRMLSDGTSTFSYDALDRTAVHTGTAMAYAGLGLEPVTDGTLKVSRDADGELLAQSGLTAAEFLTDRHNDVTATFDPTTGSVSSATAYDPWGSTTASSGSGTRGPLGFQGQWTDTATGSVHMQARWYNPGRAQFASRDSVTQTDWTVSGTNRYAYVSGNPVNGRDPSGHATKLDGGGGFGAAVGATSVQLEGGGGLGPPGHSNALQAIVDGIGVAVTAAMFWNDHKGSSPKPVSQPITFTQSNIRYYDSVYRNGEIDWDKVGHGLLRAPCPACQPSEGRHGPPPRTKTITLPKPIPPIIAPPVPDGGPGAFHVPKPDLTTATEIANTVVTTTKTVTTTTAEDDERCGQGGTVSSCYKKITTVPQGCQPLRRGDDCEPAPEPQAEASGGAAGGRNGRSTSDCPKTATAGRASEADELRRIARDLWEGQTGRRAIWDGLEVHHVVPIEWRDVFSGDVNALANLAGMSHADHGAISEAWRQWKAGLCGRTPSEQELIDQRNHLDTIYDELMQRLQ